MALVELKERPPRDKVVDSKLEDYKEILEKYGVKLPPEKLVKLAETMDQLAECFIAFEEKRIEREED